MFYILPLKNGTKLKRVHLNNYIEDLFKSDNKIDVIDSRDMVVETVDIEKIRSVMKKHKGSFPQLKFHKGDIVLDSNTLELTGGMFNRVIFNDKKFNQKLRITNSTKSFSAYNKFFDNYITELGINLDENYAEYTASTITLESNLTKRRLEITIQGIADNFGEPVCSALFINKCFVCYLDNEFSFLDDKVCIEVVEFYKDDDGYKLTLMSEHNNDSFTISMNKMLFNIDFIGLSEIRYDLKSSN